MMVMSKRRERWKRKRKTYFDICPIKVGPVVCGEGEYFPEHHSEAPGIRLCGILSHVIHLWGTPR